MGDPQKNLKIVHITGTNGKGSVALKLQKILQYSGFQSGLFTSPHILTFRERMIINDKQIEQQDILNYGTQIFQLMKDNNLNLTFFEIVWLIALNYFNQQKVDFLIAEGGLGGKLDAVNICDPILSIITSIGLDHQETLGNTIEEIAMNKSFIIKKGKPAVIGFNSKPYNIFQERAKSQNSELFIINEPSQSFNQENNLIVRKSIEVLEQKQIVSKIKEDIIKLGLESKQMCRLQNIKDNIFLDVGHNEQALGRVFDQIKKFNKRIILIFGTSAKKDLNKQVDIINKNVNQVFFVQANHQRAMDINQINQIIKNQMNIQYNIINNGNIQMTINEVLLKTNKNNDIILICGSFFIMQEARQALGFKDNYDNFDLL